MKNEKQYNTKQKEALLGLFKENPGRCFTSKEIIADESIGMGEATVYRLLAQFVKSGIITKFSDGKKGSLYQYNCCAGCSHFHLKCMVCGKLYHIDSPKLKSVEDSIAENYGFFIDNTTTTLYGYCNSCRKDNI